MKYIDFYLEYFSISTFIYLHIFLMCVWYMSSFIFFCISVLYVEEVAGAELKQDYWAVDQPGESKQCIPNKFLWAAIILGLDCCPNLLPSVCESLSICCINWRGSNIVGQSLPPDQLCGELKHPWDCPGKRGGSPLDCLLVQKLGKTVFFFC